MGRACVLQRSLRLFMRMLLCMLYCLALHVVCSLYCDCLVSYSTRPSRKHTSQPQLLYTSRSINPACHSHSKHSCTKPANHSSWVEHLVYRPHLQQIAKHKISVAEWTGPRISSSRMRRTCVIPF